MNTSMKLFLSSIPLTLFLIFSSNAFADAFTFEEEPLPPVGEFAHYGLVKGKRTSSVIRKGALKVSVLQYNPQTEIKDPTYSVSFDYDLKVSFVGRKKDETFFETPSDFFTDEFNERLREEKNVETTHFKIEHLGFEDIETKDGVIYKDCDKIKIYDIKFSKDTSQGSFLKFVESFSVQVLTSTDTNEEEKNPSPEFKTTGIDDLEVFMTYNDKVPVFGALKIDLKGKASGYRFKAGFDYDPKTQEEPPETDN